MLPSAPSSSAGPRASGRWLSASTGRGGVGAKSAELALETLESYRERYRPVAGLAGMAREFDTAGPLEIVEDRVGTGSTDFWGISFSPSVTEQGPMGEAELERGKIAGSRDMTSLPRVPNAATANATTTTARVFRRPR